MAEGTITVTLNVEAAEDALHRLEQRAERVERRVVIAIERLEKAEAMVPDGSPDA